MRYKTKPVEKDAYKYEGDGLDAMSWAATVGGNSEALVIVLGEGLFIETLEGRMHVSEGDYIICGLRGELYPCKPDIFEKTYEAVEL